MHYTVYLLQSVENPSFGYVGFTSRSILRRLIEHNRGQGPRITRKHRPLRLVLKINGFENRGLALGWENRIQQFKNNFIHLLDYMINQVGKVEGLTFHIY